MMIAIIIGLVLFMLIFVACMVLGYIYVKKV